MTDPRHDLLLVVVKRLPSDFEPYGDRSRSDAPGLDCSCGCRWFIPLEPDLELDWGVCYNQRSPRCGLLTFEHQGCREFEPDPDENPHTLEQIERVRITPRGAPITAEYVDRAKHEDIRRQYDQDVEMYTPERAAAFLLGDAIDQQSYDAACEIIHQMGLDPATIDHVKPNANDALIEEMQGPGLADLTWPAKARLSLGLGPLLKDLDRVTCGCAPDDGTPISVLRHRLVACGRHPEVLARIDKAIAPARENTATT